MPGLGLGLGLNRRQQNRFAAAAQTPGGAAQFIAAHPQGAIAQRINRLDPTGQRAANLQNFMATGQVGAGAAPRFQPPTQAMLGPQEDMFRKFMMAQQQRKGYSAAGPYSPVLGGLLTGGAQYGGAIGQPWTPV